MLPTKARAHLKSFRKSRRAMLPALAALHVVLHPEKHLHPFLAKPEDTRTNAIPDVQFVIASSTMLATSG